MTAAPVLVIGAGVTGLTTALLLAERGHPVRILTRDLPADSNSRIAGALVGPIVGDARETRALRWITRSDRIFRELAADSSTGVKVVHGRLFGDWDHDQRLAQDPGSRRCTGVDQPVDSPAGFHVHVPIVDMRRYLPYLRQRAEHAGVLIEQGLVTALDQTDAPIVVNCTGADAAAVGRSTITATRARASARTLTTCASPARSPAYFTRSTWRIQARVGSSAWRVAGWWAMAASSSAVVRSATFRPM